MRFFIAINDMPVSERIKQECKRVERNTMLSYVGGIFLLLQGAKFYGVDRILAGLGILMILHIASIHIAGEKNRPKVAIVAIVSLIFCALSAYLLSNAVFFVVAVVATFFVTFLASNLRRRQVVRDSSPALRNWPN